MLENKGKGKMANINDETKPKRNQVDQTKKKKIYTEVQS